MFKLVLGCCLALCGCATAPLPSFVVSTPLMKLYAPEDAKLRLASLGFQVPLRTGAVNGSTVAVHVSGAIELDAATPLDALGVLTCTPGALGEHFYAGAGNLLQLRSTVKGGRVRVAGDVLIRVRAYDEHTPFNAQYTRIPIEAELDVERLCRSQPPKRHAGTDADPDVLPGFGEPNVEDFPAGTRVVDIEPNVALPLLDAPGGVALHTLPPSKFGQVLVWLERKGDFDLVAAGGGPYLLGWIPKHEPRELDKQTGVAVDILGAMSGPRPHSLYTKEFAPHPLVQLPAGTVIHQLGVPRARLTEAGWARVVGAPKNGWSYVIAAVDDDVTVAGWVDTAMLGPPQAK